MDEGGMAGAEDVQLLIMSKPRAQRKESSAGKWTNDEDAALRKIVEVQLLTLLSHFSPLYHSLSSHLLIASHLITYFSHLTSPHTSHFSPLHHSHVSSPHSSDITLLSHFYPLYHSLSSHLLTSPHSPHLN